MKTAECLCRWMGSWPSRLCSAPTQGITSARRSLWRAASWQRPSWRWQTVRFYTLRQYMIIFIAFNRCATATFSHLLSIVEDCSVHYASGSSVHILVSTQKHSCVIARLGTQVISREWSHYPIHTHSPRRHLHMTRKTGGCRIFFFFLM